MLMLRKNTRVHLRPSGSSGIQILVALGFLLIAAFASLLLTQGIGRVLIGGIGGLLLFGWLVLYGLAVPSQAVLSVLLILVFFVTVANAAIEHVLHVPIGYVFELLGFGLFVGALVFSMRRFGNVRAFRWLLGLVAFNMLLGVVSSVMGRSEWLAGIWQLQYNLKWVAMLLIGMLFDFNARQERVLRLVVYWLWVPIAAVVALEILAPGMHWRLLGGIPDATLNPILGFGVRRQGPFPHSGYLALTTGGLAWVCLVYSLLRREYRWVFPLAIYVPIMLMSGQRQEILGFLVVASISVAYIFRSHWKIITTFGVLLAGMAVVLAVLLELSVATKIIDQWGGSKLGLPSERYVLSRAGIEIAQNWFPLGSGLGTYGGAGAQKFDQSQFIQLGFDQYWWFRQGSFLVDVYWPSIIAESGWFGGGALLASYMILLFTLLRSIAKQAETPVIVWFGFGLLSLLLLNSPTSASISDPRSAFWMWLLVGAAFAQVLRGMRAGSMVRN